MKLTKSITLVACIFSAAVSACENKVATVDEKKLSDEDHPAKSTPEKVEASPTVIQKEKLKANPAVIQKQHKVATVDMKKLFDEYHLTKGAQEKVKSNQAVIQQENNEKLEEIRKIADELKNLSKQIEDPVTSAKNKESLLRDRQLLANKGNALENNRRDWLNRRNKAINESIVTEMRKILSQIQDKVEVYARDNNVDMIFDKSARGTNQTLFLVFAKDQFDITQPLLDTLNKRATTLKAE